MLSIVFPTLKSVLGIQLKDAGRVLEIEKVDGRHSGNFSCYVMRNDPKKNEVTEVTFNYRVVGECNIPTLLPITHLFHCLF